MLFIDPDEKGKLDLRYLAEDIEVEYVEGLEAYTGADCVLSRLSLPWFGKYVPRHLEDGCFLIQVKRGMDLASSVGARLNESLTRMVELETKPWQRVLLFAGVLTINQEGETIINGRRYAEYSNLPGKYWKVVKACQTYWHLRGGVTDEISRETVFGEWCNVQLHCLNRLKLEPVKELWPETPMLFDPPENLPLEEVDQGLPLFAPRKEEALQRMIRVEDFRVVLAALPGIGPTLANLLWEKFNHDPGLIMTFLTDPNELKGKGVVKGLGKGKLNTIRAFLKLHPKAAWSIYNP